MNNEPPAPVEFAPSFVRFLKHLAKKYRNVRSDLEPLIGRLERGERPGTQVKGAKHAVYKVRVKNTDVARGKSAGYRVIYCLTIANRVILLAIYSKTEQADISAKEIRRMIQDYERS